MLRAYCRRTLLAFPLCLTAALVGPPPAAAQLVVFDSNGFESPTFTTGNIAGQQAFQFLPIASAGTIETGTVSAGSRAFQITGALLLPNSLYGDANFWYKSYTVAGAVKPVAS